MIQRLVQRFAVWLYHCFTEKDPGGIGYPGSRGAIVGALREALRDSLPLGVAYEVRLNEVPGGEARKVVVTLEVPR